MSKQRAKGTGWEVELLPHLRTVFGSQVERAPLKGVQDKGDFVGVPYLIEAKKTEVPRFLDWARTARKKVGAGNWWAIIWSGDRRKGEGPYVLLPLGMFLTLAEGLESSTSPSVTFTVDL
jgi:hypothetical protein